MILTATKVGMRAKFVGHDHEFHDGERQGKTGTIVADANLDSQGSNFGEGTCFWQVDGDQDQYITNLKDLELVEDRT